jgi:hypothetical protein
MADNPGIVAVATIARGCKVNPRTVRTYLRERPSVASRSIQRQRTSVSDREALVVKAAKTEAEMMAEARRKGLELLIAAAGRDDGSEGTYSFLSQRAAHASFQHGELAERARIEREALASPDTPQPGDTIIVEAEGWTRPANLKALPKPADGAA